jgi:hypothetical protein
MNYAHYLITDLKTDIINGRERFCKEALETNPFFFPLIFEPVWPAVSGAAHGRTRTKIRFNQRICFGPRKRFTRAGRRLLGGQGQGATPTAKRLEPVGRAICPAARQNARINRQGEESTPVNSDRVTKQIIISTLCLMAGGLVATVCSLALHQLQIPVEVKDLTTYIVGVLSGMLIKTGVDSVTGQIESPSPDGAAVAEPATEQVTTPVAKPVATPPTPPSEEAA